MAEKTCGFTGHRDIPDSEIESVKHGLRKEIDKAIAPFFLVLRKEPICSLRKSLRKNAGKILPSIWRLLFHTETAI